MDNQITTTGNSKPLSGPTTSERINSAAFHIGNEIKNGKLTIERACKGRQISDYKRTEGSGNLDEIIGIWCLEMARCFNVARPLTVEQVATIAHIISKDYWHMKLAQIALFFEQAKTGKYGEAYNSLDVPTIIGWLNQYQGEIADYHESQAGKGMPVYHPKVIEAINKALPEEAFKPTLRDKLQDPEFKRVKAEYAKMKIAEKAKQAAERAEKEAKESDLKQENAK